MADHVCDGSAAAGRRAADDAGLGAELLRQLEQIIGPFGEFGVAAGDADIGFSAVAAIVNENPVALVRDHLGDRLDAFHGAAAAGHQNHPGPIVAEYSIVHFYSAYLCCWH